MKSPKKCSQRALVLGAVLVAGSSVALAQEQPADPIEAIRQEMHSSRQAYEARIAELERRLEAMERARAQVQPEVMVASPSSLAASTGAPTEPSAAGTAVAQQSVAQRPTVEVAAGAENAALEQRVSALEQHREQTNAELAKVNSPDFFDRVLPDNLKFTGYFRGGYGVNQNGGAQGKVESPDNLASGIGPGRFGNEPDTYGDLTLRYTMPQATDESLRVALQTTFSFRYNGVKNNYANQHQDGVDLLFREAFVSVGNVFKTAPEVEFWAGQRWYDRQDIHMYDYFYLDTSGYGGGVENIKLGPGRFSAAWLGGTDSTVQVYNRYALTKQVLDFRWSELPSFYDGKGMLWVSPQYVNGGSGGASVPDKTWGLAVGWVQENDLGQGTNKFSVQYGFGGAYGFNTAVPLADPSVGRPSDWLKHAQTALVTNNLVWRFDERFSVNWAVIAQWDDMGYTYVDPVTGNSGPGSSRFFITSGVRPLYMLTDRFGIESEIAAEWASRDRFSTEDRQTALSKFILAGVIRPDGDVMSRPEIRLYGGYYYWGGSMPSDYVADGSKPGDVGAWVFGVQVEMWW